MKLLPHWHAACCGNWASGREKEIKRERERVGERAFVVFVLAASAALYAWHRDYKFCTYATPRPKNRGNNIRWGGRVSRREVNERDFFRFLHYCQYMYMTWLRQLLRSSGQLMTSLLTVTSALKAFLLICCPDGWMMVCCPDGPYCLMLQLPKKILQCCQLFSDLYLFDFLPNKINAFWTCAPGFLYPIWRYYIYMTLNKMLLGISKFIICSAFHIFFMVYRSAYT